jgi:dTDP-4-dehydrorhamnose reductase
MKKILILGAAGMAGHIMYYYLQSLHKYELFTACFRNKLEKDSIILNVYDTNGIKTMLNDINPDYIINCVGILVKGSKESPENAIYINAYYPHLLARLLNEYNAAARLIHISTDCVFSGEKGLYTDADIKDALDVYGMTKNLGEIIDDTNLTIRTSIIGPELKENGEGLFHWIFKQWEIGEINGYEKSLWGGVTTLELAKAVEQCISCSITGLYQLTNGEKISKYELVRLIVNQFNLNVLVQKADGIVTDKSILPSKRNNFSFIVPSYTTMIEELYNFMFAHKSFYTFYLE